MMSCELTNATAVADIRCSRDILVPLNKYQMCVIGYRKGDLWSKLYYRGTGLTIEYLHSDRRDSRIRRDTHCHNADHGLR